jgi:hypothetical protein
MATWRSVETNWSPKRHGLDHWHTTMCVSPWCNARRAIMWHVIGRWIQTISRIRPCRVILVMGCTPNVLFLQGMELGGMI